MGFGGGGLRLLLLFGLLLFAQEFERLVLVGLVLVVPVPGVLAIPVDLIKGRRHLRLSLRLAAVASFSISRCISEVGLLLRDLLSALVLLAMSVGIVLVEVHLHLLGCEVLLFGKLPSRLRMQCGLLFGGHESGRGGPALGDFLRPSLLFGGLLLLLEISGLPPLLRDHLVPGIAFEGKPLRPVEGGPLLLFLLLLFLGGELLLVAQVGANGFSLLGQGPPLFFPGLLFLGLDSQGEVFVGMLLFSLLHRAPSLVVLCCKCRSHHEILNVLSLLGLSGGPCLELLGPS